MLDADFSSAPCQDLAERTLSIISETNLLPDNFFDLVSRRITALEHQLAVDEQRRVCVAPLA